MCRVVSHVTRVVVAVYLSLAVAQETEESLTDMRGARLGPNRINSRAMKPWSDVRVCARRRVGSRLTNCVYAVVESAATSERQKRARVYGHLK